MTTHGASYQITYCNGPPVAIAPNNTFAIDALTNILYICENGIWLQLSGGGGAVGANPTAVAGPVAINGVAVTYMRSDASPAIQKGTNAQFGIVEVDGVTITSAAGVISAVAGSSTLAAGSTATSGFAVGDLIVNDTGNVINPVADVAAGSVLVSGGVGAKPAYSATPTLTSVKFGGGGTALGNYVEGTWVPTDQSGAGLAFTVNKATYTRIGNWVFVDYDITYPATASGANASIGGLPFASASQYATGMAISLTILETIGSFVQPGQTKFGFFNMTTGSQVINSNLASGDVSGQLIYPAT